MVANSCENIEFYALSSKQLYWKRVVNLHKYCLSLIRFHVPVTIFYFQYLSSTMYCKHCLPQTHAYTDVNKDYLAGRNSSNKHHLRKDLIKRF